MKVMSKIMFAPKQDHNMEQLLKMEKINYKQTLSLLQNESEFN